MAKLLHLHLLLALAFILLSSVVQAQWPWGGNNGGSSSEDEEDDDYNTGGSSSRGGNGGRPSPSPRTTTPRGPAQTPWNQPKASTSPPWNSPWQTTQPKNPQTPWNQQPQPQPQQPKQPQQPWNQQPKTPKQPKQPQQAPQPWNPSKPSNQPNTPWQAPNQQPAPSRGPPAPVTVTITRTQPPKQPAQPTQPPATQKPPNQPVIAQPTPSRTNTWSQPSQWGPSRQPFGPTGTPTGPQTIATTTTDAYREPVPYLTTCGRSKYVEYDVSNAIITGCYYKNRTQTVNNSGFPKLFVNNFGFNFGDTQPPYYEYPLIESGAFIGGPAGPDRVIFNEQCYLAGEITQTNAGTRQWTECSENY